MEMLIKSYLQEARLLLYKNWQQVQSKVTAKRARASEFGSRQMEEEEENVIRSKESEEIKTRRPGAC